MDRSDYAYLIAFGVALVGGGWAQWFLRENLGDYRQFAGPVGALPPLLGHVERALFLGALLAGEPLFIGLWLTLKVVGAGEVLSRWNVAPTAVERTAEAEKTDADRAALARQTYQRFLTLSGVSLLWAGGGWAIGEAIKTSDYSQATLIGAGLVLGTAYLWSISPGGRLRRFNWHSRLRNP